MSAFIAVAIILAILLLIVCCFCVALVVFVLRPDLRRRFLGVTTVEAKSTRARDEMAYRTPAAAYRSPGELAFADAMESAQSATSAPSKSPHSPDDDELETPVSALMAEIDTVRRKRTAASGLEESDPSPPLRPLSSLSTQQRSPHATLDCLDTHHSVNKPKSPSTPLRIPNSSIERLLTPPTELGEESPANRAAMDRAKAADLRI